ncbi:alcohol dehydrogenase class IV [Aliiruegeria haliotis]|uniref:Alcohol dehydrogenase class IV n=1 Tax=Aliiruegeria haliotis TaxID=1280846 RepID=A0A2T0RYK6_9RHOB|nr:iron-containing alcohol dehydrogenase [Aliiruegeria haliotis]PRY26113.1 alcohol dehydrogenase class IV [Aliiruegeria haliotis]
MTPAEFTFATATEIRFGRGAGVQSIPDILALGSRILVVTGANAGRAAWLVEALVGDDREIGCFPVAREPDVTLVEAGVSAARAADAELIVSIGGGAAIDTGKAISALTPARRPTMDHLEVVGKGLPLERTPLAFVAIPTTAGTGAEVTRNAVIGVPGARRKVSLRDRSMLPRLAIVDPALTDSCPRAVTLASGLDAVTQVIEPYVCARSNPFTDALCRSAIPAGLVALRRLMRGENAQARETMAWVSLCGGLALSNAGLGVIHGLAGPLGGLTGAPHGAICGALLPHGLAANAARVGDQPVAARFWDVRRWIAEALGGGTEEAFDRLADWSGQNGLPDLGALGISADDRLKAAEAAAASSSMKANPVELTVAELVELMEAAS